MGFLDAKQIHTSKQKIRCENETVIAYDQVFTRRIAVAFPVNSLA